MALSISIYTSMSVGFFPWGIVNTRELGFFVNNSADYLKEGLTYKQIGLFLLLDMANYLTILIAFYDFLLPLHPIKVIMSP